MHIARSVLAITLLVASIPAFAVDRTLCVDTVAEFGAAIDDAVSTDPAYDRVVVRLDPGRFLAERPANDLCCEGRDPVADASDRDERTKSHLDRLAASPGP